MITRDRFDAVVRSVEFLRRATPDASREFHRAARLARVVYGVIRYNAWREAANQFGYERRGPILLGVTDPVLVSCRDRAVQLLSAACECMAEERITDAAQCKMVLNLTNSLSALVGFGSREIEDYTCTSRAWDRMCT